MLRETGDGMFATQPQTAEQLLGKSHSWKVHEILEYQQELTRSARWLLELGQAPPNQPERECEADWAYLPGELLEFE